MRHIMNVWFEISYNLRMREGAECGGSPDEGVRFITLAARETILLNMSLSFTMI